MYVLVYGSDDYAQFKQYIIVAKGNTLEEVIRHRKVSGELVFDYTTKEIIKDTSWLFQWEKENQECYAQKQIARNKKLSGYHIFD